MTDARGYKWIAAEIERLDPHVDYERIWTLSTCYYVNNFMMNFLYSTGFPHFILPPHGGETIGRGGKGPVVSAGQVRQDETVDKFWTWFEFGPSDPATKASVEHVNRLHEAIWKKMPGNFTKIEDFVYTMCWIGADMHRLRLRIGLPGFTEKQKIATVHYWRDIAEMFRSEAGPVAQEFPADFDGMLAYMAEYEAVQWEYSPEGYQSCQAILDQFARRWFPPGMRWAGRAMILSMLDEPAHRVHRLPTPPAPIVKANELGLKLVLWSKERLLPDPKITTPEKNRRKRAAKAPAVQQVHATAPNPTGRQVAGLGCPHGSAAPDAAPHASRHEA